jgi:serine/threonine-protein kinase
MAHLVLLGSAADFLLNLSTVILWLFDSAKPIATEGMLPFVGNLLTVASAGAIVVATRTARIRHTTLLNLGLGFEVFLCLVISLSSPVSEWQTSGTLPALTWVTPLIILFPLIVPVPPRRTLVVAILAAATRPIAILALAAAGQVEASRDDLISTLFNPAIAVVFAYFGSRVVHGLGVEVAEARRMGSYVLERVLGRGAMGEVWLGRHRMLARPAAVKLVRSDRLDGGGGADEVLARFEREAQATATLRSPHTIDLFDFGVSDDGTFYYVMELLDGLDLDSLVRRFGPVPAARAVHILRQVCHSLAEAHETGLIHRDIKPANVYLCRYGLDLDFVKVLDFGLVKSARTPGEGDDPSASVAGEVRGTPAFMAPEQALGSDEVDARSDLYAVGCLGYWLLTGQSVFDGASPPEVLMHHVKTSPLPPSLRGDVAVPEALERAVMACLEKDPAQRPQSANELDALLAACSLESPWTRDRAKRWYEAHGPEAAVEPG